MYLTKLGDGSGGFDCVCVCRYLGSYSNQINGSFPSVVSGLNALS